MTQEEEMAFKTSMKSYPSHFALDVKFGFTQNCIKKILRTLNDIMTTTGFELDAEQTRAYNLLSYVHWRLKDFTKANEYLEKALSKRKEDVMALANQSWMLWKDSKFSDARRVVKKLEKLKERKDLITIAESEQAFAYSKLGPRYYMKAINKFKEVINADRVHEIDKTYIYLWKFGLGLILKRQLNIVNTFSFDILSNFHASVSEAVDVLHDVANNAYTARCQARAWVVLGEVAYTVLSHEMISPEDRSKLPKIITGMKPDKFFDKAIDICDDDVYVLQRCGKQARYSKDYSKSEKLLRRSIGIRGTSLSHHHLALTLRSVLNTDIAKSSSGHRQGSRNVNSQRYFPTKYPNIENMENAKHQMFRQASGDSTKENESKGCDCHPTNDEYHTRHLCRGETRKTHSGVNRGSKNIIKRTESCQHGQCELLVANTSSNQETLPKQYKVPKFMKSPKSVLVYPDEDKRVNEILDHLDKALECSPTNCSAMYDKGLVLRSLRRLQMAEDLFGTIKGEKECSELLAVKCIEQQALCLLELAKTESEPDRINTLRNDAKELLFSAIEKAAHIASKVPLFHPRVSAFPSIQEMLLRDINRQGSPKRTILKEFAKLYELVGHYGEALSFYKEIRDMKGEDAKDPYIILKMAQNYVKQKDFRDGLLFLDLIEASCTKLADKNRKIYFEAYLEGALSALAQGDFNAAKSRFRRTVRFCSKRNILSDDVEEDDCTYDIHIMTTSASEEKGFKLYKLLKETCGLKVSINNNQTAEELKYSGQFEGVCNIMEQSFLIVIILDNTSMNERDRLFINMAIDLNVDDIYGTGIISICLGEVTIPREIKPFPVFQQPPYLDFSDKQHQWLKDFFWKAGKQTFPLNLPDEAESDN